MELYSLIFDFVGTVLVAYAAIRVHHRILHDHAVDEGVFSTMKKEQLFAVLGVLLILAGFVLEVILISGF